MMAAELVSLGIVKQKWQPCSVLMVEGEDR